MAAYAALVSLFNILDQINNHPCLLASLDKYQMESFSEKIDFFLDFVENYNFTAGGISKEEVEELEDQITSAVHEAEDVIESYIVNQILSGSAELLISDVRLHHRCLFGLQRILEDMDSIKNKVLKVKEKTEVNVQKPTNSTLSASSIPLTTDQKSGSLGFDEELKELMHVLIGQRSSRQIISIVGMGGTGKTTLARHVYEDSLIVHHFDFLAWATISQEFNVKEILLQLVSLTSGSVGKLGERLHKILVGRRYLIILDDIWSPDVWDNIRNFFPDNDNGSRVVITTRLSNLAIDLPSSSINMKFLDEHKSWKLFCQKVFGQEDCPSHLVAIGKKIVEQCKGLPLSIVVIGGLLRKSYGTEEYWQNVANNINSILNSRENGQCLDVLYLSYSHLPAHLKPCFLYMGTYREDYEIRVSKMIRLWVAEGFLKTNGVQMLEEIAEDYLKDLIDRNLILVSGHRANGKIKYCRIHDLLRELCLSVANKEKFFCVLRRQSIPQSMDRERRLIFHETSICHYNEISEASQSALLARSLIGYVTNETTLKCRLLRVLNKSAYWCLGDGYQNVNLRFVDCKFFTKGKFNFDSWVSLIWNLQTFVIEGDAEDCVPVSLNIWKMPQLRHLNCPKILLSDPPPSDEEDDSVVLGNLQTLGKVVNFRLGEETCKRIPNIKKLYLMYYDIDEGYDHRLYKNLHNLRRLHKLESLHIDASEKAKINAFPTQLCSLNKLSLQGFSVDWKYLSKVIGSLPQLEVLKLRGTFSEVCEWSCVEGKFLRLKFLEIYDCALKSWTLDSASSFPVLEKLVLNLLPDLNEIPSGIGQIPTLQIILLKYCSESAVISAMKIKEERQESFGNDGLQIQVQMFAEEVERFREKVEIEGLSINYIQLLHFWDSQFMKTFW